MGVATLVLPSLYLVMFTSPLLAIVNKRVEFPDPCVIKFTEFLGLAHSGIEAILPDHPLPTTTLLVIAPEIVTTLLFL